MKTLRHLRLTFLPLLCLSLLLPASARAGLWCTAYFPGYNDGNSMSPTDIDFSVVTHVVHFAVIPQSDGSLDSSSNSVDPAGSAAIIAAAHAAGRKALICVGGQNSVNFPAACSSGTIGTFVGNLINFMASRGYDGIDIDWEPFNDPSDGPLLTNLITRLRLAMNTINTNLLLTTALPLPDPWNPTTLPQVMASVDTLMDQINLQTYDLSGPYPGWICWHNSCIYDNGVTLPGGLQAPSVNGAVLRFITNGVPAAKLGLGITFHGQLWTDQYYPGQPLNSDATMAEISYNDIVANYSPASYIWDNGAIAPFISVTNSSPNKFISFDDPRACEGKVSYARNHGLGGMIIWELKLDHVSGQTDPLLNAVKQALATPGKISAQRTNSTLTMDFSGAPLGNYAVQWTTNLAKPVWNTLSTVNTSNATGIVTIPVTDTISNGAAARFYRVTTTPP